MPRTSFPVHMPPRAMVRIMVIVTAALGVLATACGGGGNSLGDPTAPGAWSAEALAVEGGRAVFPIVVNSQLGVGSNRLAFGFFSTENALISDAVADVRLFTLDDDNGTLVSEHELRMVQLQEEEDDHATRVIALNAFHGEPLATLFVAQVELHRSQWWGADLRVTLGDEQTEEMRVRFFVSERTPEPMIGETPPASTQTVLRDVDIIERIDSSVAPVPALHELTVAEALRNGRPTVVAFATPAFCQTRFCGPIMSQVVVPLWEQFGDEVDFIHIEPFDLTEARAGRLVPVPQMEEWGLTTEPWIFLLDGSGTVRAKYEGVTDVFEVRPALKALLDPDRAS